MSTSPLRFRQVHLDFHTSPAIPGIGEKFDTRKWQETLKSGHVDSITLFSKCHHGWSYHPTKVGKMHPHLGFDLLKAQYEATKETGINAPIYLSAGVDNLASYEHPEWREVGPDGQYTGWAKQSLEAGFHMMDFHSPYLDYLCEQIIEAVTLFPDCDGIFLDIISQNPSCTRWSLDYMHANGLDPLKPEDRARSAEAALQKYYKRTTAAARINNPTMPIFHNSGHIPMGRRDLLEKFFSHLELESLPTGGWGYDHFPASAKYCQNLPHDFLGMTGKFHTTWGEFGGYKHPNALRYECAAMLAFGSKCSIGDQLHPSGELDISTYELIGTAYREVEEKEAWCRNVKNVADIALLASASTRDHPAREMASDTGASRILLEGHFLYTILETGMDFSGHPMVILPDDVKVGEDLKRRLCDYLANGGKVLATSKAGLNSEGSGFWLPDAGAEYHGTSPFCPDYILPAEDLRPSFLKSPQVMYLSSERIRTTTGTPLGDVYDPYFNRTYKHFCSHQHAPNRPEPSGFHSGVQKNGFLYLAHPVFSLYRGYGSVSYRHLVTAAINRLLGDARSLKTNLPSTGRISVMEQPAENRTIIHLLFANTVQRGGALSLSGGTTSNTQTVEIIEDLLPLHDTTVSIRLKKPVSIATLEPGGRRLPVEVAQGWIQIRIPEFTCHQMVVLHHG